MSIFLHLSDLHVGADHGFCLPGEPAQIGAKEKTVGQCIIEDLKQCGIQVISGLIISGDLTTYGRWVDYRDQVIAVLDELCRDLNVDKQSVVVVPGNHDYEWYEEDRLKGAYLRITEQSRALKYAANFAHETHFRAFLQQFYGENDREYSGVVRRHALPEYELQIALLDSCRIVSTQYHEYGYVDPRHIRRVKDQFNALDSRGVRVLVLHHHVGPVTPTEALDGKEISLTLNAGDVMELALECGVTVIFHGHHHYPCVLQSNRTYERNGRYELMAGRGVHVASAGSTGVRGDRRRSDVPNTYSIVNFGDREIELDVRRIRPVGGPWGSLFRQTIPLNRDQ